MMCPVHKRDAAFLAAATAVFISAHCIVGALDARDRPTPHTSEVPAVTAECLTAIQSSAIPMEVVQATKPTYTENDLELLALGIYQEAGGDECSDETREMVGTVILNRVADERYPNTLREVLLQKKQYGELHWTGIKWPERALKPSEYQAVQRAYCIAEKLLEGYRVLPADVVFQSEYIQGEIVAHQDGFYFCR